MIRKLIPVILFFIVISCGDDEPEYVDDTPSTKIDAPKDTSAGEKKTKSDNRFFNEKPVAVISPVEAGDYNGKVVTVKGFVADVYKSEKVAYLNFVKKYPDNPFTAVIFASKFSEFENIYDYKMKNVEVTGRVSFYRGRPQIILNDPNQIKIVD